MMRMVARAMAAAFGTWRGVAALRKAALGLADRCVRRMRNAALYGAWSRWRATASEMRDQRRTMGGALRRMLMQGLCRGWNRWREAARDAKQMDQALKRGVMRLKNWFVSLSQIHPLWLRTFFPLARSQAVTLTSTSANLSDFP